MWTKVFFVKVKTLQKLLNNFPQIAEGNILNWKNRGKFGEKEEKAFTFCGIVYSKIEK